MCYVVGKYCILHLYVTFPHQKKTQQTKNEIRGVKFDEIS